MNQYWIFVRMKDEPGAGVYKAILNADNPHTALAMAKSMYGRLIVHEVVSQVV